MKLGISVLLLLFVMTIVVAQYDEDYVEDEEIERKTKERDDDEGQKMERKTKERDDDEGQKLRRVQHIRPPKRKHLARDEPADYEDDDVEDPPRRPPPRKTHRPKSSREHTSPKHKHCKHSNECGNNHCCVRMGPGFRICQPHRIDVCNANDGPVYDFYCPCRQTRDNRLYCEAIVDGTYGLCRKEKPTPPTVDDEEKDKDLYYL